MTDHSKNLRRTRADMLGTDDEEHYWECHKAADYIDELKALIKEAYMAGFDAGFDAPASIRDGYAGHEWQEWKER